MYVCSKEKKRPWFEREKRGIYVRVLEEERQLVNDVIKITKNIEKKHKVKEKSLELCESGNPYMKWIKFYILLNHRN